MLHSIMDLTSSSTEVILAYSSTGLGHLRVTNALFSAAPKGVNPKLFRTKHSGATWLHRLTSMSPITRRILDWSQNGLPEEFFTRTYRYFLRQSGGELAEELQRLIEQEFNIVKTVVIVATHFGLAHQIAANKEKLAETLGVKIVLAVCVTDDSPQKLWYVEGADVLFVPSIKTKEALLSYGKKSNMKNLNIEVIPYPLSEKLLKKLTSEEWKDRLTQLDPKAHSLIQVSVPISGAATNLTQTEELMHALYKKEPRFHFYVICRENMYTYEFIKRLGRKKYVSLITSKHDREIVTYYNDLISGSTFAFEITKPSEQAFKTLISTQKKGGMILLFLSPVGRQELDNLSFLKRNNLFSNRGFLLKSETVLSAEFILQGLKSDIFLKACKEEIHRNNIEVRSDGAVVFWERLTKNL